MPSAGRLRFIAQSVTRVLGVYKLDFGVPEAMWVIEVKDFPAVVTMDCARRQPARRYRSPL